MIGSLVRIAGRKDQRGCWRVSLDSEPSETERPAPFVRPSHDFNSFAAAAAWLGML